MLHRPNPVQVKAYNKFVIACVLIVIVSGYSVVGQNAKSQCQDTVAYYKVDPFPVFSYRGVSNTGDACKAYFAEHVVIPKEMSDDGIMGKIYIQFIVEKDGSLTNIKLLKGVDPKLDRMAIKAVKRMPPWKPGKLNGKIVRSWYAVAVKWSYPENSKQLTTDSDHGQKNRI